MKKIVSIFAILFTFSLAFSQSDKSSLKSGDIIFQDLDCGPLCEAIETVTDGFQHRDFSHVGIIVKNKDGNLFVIEAIGTKVQKTPINLFFQRSEKVIAGRLIPEYQKLIKKSCLAAEAMVGRPYDDRFIMNNDSLYCSELIYEAFKSANKGEPIFDLMPMTFKDPSTNKTFAIWAEYYKELHSTIPESELGINPGLISRSEKLIMVYDYLNK